MTPAPPATPLPPRFRVLRSHISALSLEQAVTIMQGWIEQHERHYINLCTADTVLQAYDNPELARILDESGLAAPDGMPLVWLGRRQSRTTGRVYGPDLMLQMCGAGLQRKTRHFFYGATPDVLEDLKANLERKNPGLVVAGTLAPPFRPLTATEETETARMINAARPDIVWVGLGTPKQDFWVAHFRTLLEAPVMVAVGAAFNFHAGHIPQAPRWMMRCGLEWFFRLIVEPRRLWRRYLLGNPRFALLVMRQKITGLP